MDRGFFLPVHAIRRQLAAMPHELYLIRLIHSHTGQPFPGERLWSAAELSQAATVRFLRLRNREGGDLYLQPDAEDHNAGYILLDLDRADPQTMASMCRPGHEPGVVVETSPGHLQAWVPVSPLPLEPAVASQIGKHLARTYDGDRASTDWRHLGRLAAFTNQKPARRQLRSDPPGVKLRHAQRTWARSGTALVQAAERQRSLLGPPAHHRCAAATSAGQPPRAGSLPSLAAAEIYSRWMDRLPMPQRFSPPHGSIADRWIAQELLRRHIPLAPVQAILELGSPGFPRRHSNPEDYLRRRLARAAREL